MVSKAANAVGKIPILGDIARAGIGAARLSLGPTAILIDAGSRIARGENLAKAVKGAVMGQVDAVRDQLKLAEMVAPFIPGIGTGVGAALGAANALAAGKPITEAILSAARSAIPGGAIAQTAFDVALNLANGKIHHRLCCWRPRVTGCLAGRPRAQRSTRGRVWGKGKVCRTPPSRRRDEFCLLPSGGGRARFREGRGEGSEHSERGPVRHREPRR